MNRLYSILLSTTIFLFLGSGCVNIMEAESIAGSTTASQTQNISPVGDNSTTAMQTISQFGCVSVTNGYQAAQFIEVIDGDTIDVRRDGSTFRVRYIGIDAPEYDEGQGKEAEDFNSSLVSGQELYLIRDVSETDVYGRLLRYVFTKTSFVNYEILTHGYARQRDYSPDTACSETFTEAEKLAMTAGAGIWASPEGNDEALAVQITNLNYNGNAGDNEPDEYVEIQNTGSRAVDVSGWYIKDQGKHRFVFPAITLAADETCRVYTAEDHPETCGLSFGIHDSAVWNNGGDCATLYDAGGLLIDEFCYP